ncbi:MAG: tetratricopeptide repeat protein, partial [candidate division KSB1 bacterium]|nr:tetratricopeptide repeat protein [candidate division KSB1 bacterium]
WLEETFRERKRLLFGVAYAAIAFMLIIAPVNLFAFNFHTHDRTGEYVASDYSYNILQTCEPNAIIFTNGDNDTFPLWFLQYVKGIRTDIRVVNLSLLNTQWYIKQLKHQEPKVPISLTDEQIDKLEVRVWKGGNVEIPVPPEVKRRELGIEISEPETLRFYVKPTVFGQALRVQDIMVLNIVLANRWQKPIYFAVTVSDQNKVNLDEFLRMDGLSFKLIPGKAEGIDAARLEKNLFEVFQYRNLDNPKVYFNDNIVGLLQNYRAAFLRLAHYYLMNRDHAGVVRTLDKMNEIMPFKVIPAPDPRLALQVGQYYYFAGRNDRFLEMAEYTYSQAPEDPEVVGAYVSLLERQGQYAKAKEILQKWLAMRPMDSEAQKKIEELDKLMNRNAGDTLQN